MVSIHECVSTGHSSNYTRRVSALGLFALLFIFITACATGTLPTPPGTGGVWGHVRLVPREGVTPVAPGGGGYGDPALRDVRFVDYSRPGFAVVYANDVAAPSDTTEITIRSVALGSNSATATDQITRLEPSDAAVGGAGSIVIFNKTSRMRVVTDPSAGTIHRVEPGTRVEIRKPGIGLHSFFLIDDPSVSARVFVAAGPYSIVSGRGRYELSGLPPGTAEIRAWHPRFPPTASIVEVPTDATVRLDLQMGIKIDDKETPQ